MKWLHKAAERGVAAAQYKLALSLAFGRGVAPDYAEAYAWLSLAGTSEAQAAKLLDDLSKAMSPEQIVAGHRRARVLRVEIEARLKSAGK